MEPFVDVSLNILSALYSKEPHPQVLDLVKQVSRAMCDVNVIVRSVTSFYGVQRHCTQCEVIARCAQCGVILRSVA